MSLNRIQKLLFSEYCDFEDMVLVESPFAQTTREGQGLRQVQIGLTPTKLVLAIDVLPPMEEAEIYCSDTDPEIETLELIAVYPVECVNLSVYRRRKRQSLKAHFCNNRVLYFELGGFEKRKMFWNLWCERVKFLCPEDVASSVSETSVATSTSVSTLNIVSAARKVSKSGKSQYWCKFAKNKMKDKNCKWVEQFLYLGGQKKHNCEILHCPHIQLNNIKKQMVDNPIKLLKENIKKIQDEKNLNFKELLKSKQEASNITKEPIDIFAVNPPVPINISSMSENAVKCWEKVQNTSKNRGRHPRRYGFMPKAHLLYGLGPWNIHSGDRVSIQMKRSASAIRIRRQPNDPEMNLPISKRLLTVSVSCETFHMSRGLNVDTCVSKLAVPGPKALLFWTPEYWYRPQPAYDSYNTFLQHMRNLKKNLSENTIKGQSKKKSFIKRKLKNMQKHVDPLLMDVNQFGVESNYEKYLQRLRTALKIEVALTAWDFDSTTLAYQLTMLDKALFMKIQPYELQIIMSQKSSKNTPNINSLIAFSHRVSCLITTEILRDNSDKVRSRLIVRFINAADKCDKISNYHSCRSILSGLQSISVYRLQNTWAYLRLHHAIKYQLFENLCRQYSDPRLSIYQKSFYLASASPPYIPYIGDLLGRLLDKVSPIPENFLSQIIYDETKQVSIPDEDKENIKSEFEIKKFFNITAKKFSVLKVIKFLTSLKLWPMEETEKTPKKVFQNFSEGEKDIDIQSLKKTNSRICNKHSDDKVKKLQDVIEFLEVSQKAASKYALTKNHLAQEYLLKARYREDRDNFYNFKIKHTDAV